MHLLLALLEITVDRLLCSLRLDLDLRLHLPVPLDLLQ